MTSLLRSTLLFTLGLTIVGCGDPPVEVPDPDKGRIDKEALQAGLTVVVNGDVGSVIVPFEIAVPEATEGTGGDDVIEDDLSGAVSLVITSRTTGTTADLASGTIVDSPTGPGEWSWQLNGGRDEASLAFFNATTNGLTLKDGVSYGAMLSVASNDYVETEEAFSFDVAVVVN